MPSTDISRYAHDFLQHTYLHHLTRLDHRHNFSPYNMLLYLLSSPDNSSFIPWERLAFLPQLLLSAIILPLAYAKSSLYSTLFAQTFAFVAFNKVCTSQYFMWYLVLLPFYLPGSIFTRKPAFGIAALGLWIASQAVWLREAFLLEFHGIPRFLGLWGASLGFLVVNCVILAAVTRDMGAGRVG